MKGIFLCGLLSMLLVSHADAQVCCKVRSAPQGRASVASRKPPAPVARAGFLDLDARRPSILIVAIDRQGAGLVEIANVIDEVAGQIEPAQRAALKNRYLDFSPVLKTQLRMVETASRVTRVVVLTPDYASAAEVREFMSQVRSLREPIEQGKIEIAAAEHDTAWVRDYGPQWGAGGGSTVCIDAIYDDVRHQTMAKRQRQVIARERQKLVEKGLSLVKMKNQRGAALEELFKDSAMDEEGELDEELPDAGDQQADGEEAMPDEGEDSLKNRLLRYMENEEYLAQLTEEAENNKDLLYLWEQADAVLADAELNKRLADDACSFEIAQLVLGQADVRVTRPELYIDGGNLLRLTNGVILSTSELFVRNYGKENELSATIAKVYGGKPIYLEPLPGPVIKHADMFVLPARGNVLLVASYDRKSAAQTEEYEALEPQLRSVVNQAAEAMSRNVQTLRKAGFSVIEVPSPMPQWSVADSLDSSTPEIGEEDARPRRKREVRGDAVFFPTILNAATIHGEHGRSVVMVPYYRDISAAIQSEAHELIRKAFQNEVELAPIECTEAAKAQGALHCLSLMLPLDASRFASAASSRR